MSGLDMPGRQLELTARGGAARVSRLPPVRAVLAGKNAGTSAGNFPQPTGLAVSEDKTGLPGGLLLGRNQESDANCGLKLRSAALARPVHISQQ